MPIYKSPPPPSSLPLLPLPSSLVLLPHARISLPVPRDISARLVDLLRSVPNPAEGDDVPLLAAVPVPPIASNTGDSLKLHNWGTAARLVRLVRSTSSSDTITLHGLARLELPNPPSTPLDPLPAHAVRFPPQTHGEVDRAAWDTFKAAAAQVLARLDAEAGGSERAWDKLAAIVREVSVDRAGWIADVVVGAVITEYEDRLRYLECADVPDRIKLAAELLSKHLSISELKNKIANTVTTSLTNAQKAFYLRQQLHAIQRELALLSSPTSPSSPAGALPAPPAYSSDGEASELDADADGEEELAEVKKKIEGMVKGSEERKAGVREWRRLKRIPPGSIETGVIRGYLEWLTALPWPTADGVTQTQERDALLAPDFLANAKATLEKDHYGLEKIKRRLLEYLVVLRLRALSTPPPALELPAVEKADSRSDVVVTAPPPPPGIKAPILLLVGPPGTGKTSIASSLARALNRPFERISLGGVRDEASVRGHRRTYVASGPGMIISALRRAGRRDCVMLLDEIDKLAGRGGVMGDPAAALLEVLDPEQNARFVDHYLGIPFDLSQVTWIATANTLDGMSEPLLDRCEIIHLSGYTSREKMHIARNYLVPKQLRQNGMTEEKVVLGDETIRTIATLHTREAGVRSLERQIGAVVRHKAVELSELVDLKEYNPEVRPEQLEGILGLGRWDPKEMERKEKVGVVWGLVFTGEGEGGVLSVETVKVPGEGKLRLTGCLGEVIRESGEIALSWVKSHAYALGITAVPSHDPLKHPDPIDIHLHLPAGATRKDGPSAGVAMACAFVSLLTGRTVPPHIAMTGELTLRGSVTPVGGIKEKVLGAHRAGMTKLILPTRNKRDVEQDVPPEVRQEIEFAYAANVEDALDAAFGQGVFWKVASFVESRL